GRLLLRLLLRGHCHPDAVDKFAAKQGLLTAKQDHVTDPIIRLVADTGAQDVEVGRVDDEALALTLETQDRLQALVELDVFDIRDDSAGALASQVVGLEIVAVPVGVVFAFTHDGVLLLWAVAVYSRSHASPGCLACSRQASSLSSCLMRL